MTLTLLPLLLAAHSAASTGQVPPRAQAVRAVTPPRIDGKLDDPAWRDAFVLDGFVQVMPDQGKPATERTEVRILYDDHALYFGVRCYDSDASANAPRLGRRDNLPESDVVTLAIDPFHDRRSAYLFEVNNAGVIGDGVILEGQGQNMDWDGVWRAETSMDAEGWTVEIALPFSTLRFPKADVQTWGFHIRRYISRKKESDDWNLIRVTDPSFVPRFADLDGIRGVQPGLSLQLLPYASATLHPSFATDSLAPRSEQTAQVGLDIKYGLSGALTLDATINPDFGQVEVDPEVVNLSAYEVFFPEKRPFFLEGVEIFQSAGSLVYTRRIGAAPAEPDPQHGGDIIQLDSTARIIGAAKLTGNLRPGTAVGLLSAYVDSTEALERVGGGELSPTYKLEATPASFFNVARLRQVIRGDSAVSGTVTSVLRGSGQPPANVVAADLDLRSSHSDYTAQAGFGWAFTKACDPALTDTYHGGSCDASSGGVAFGKTGGELRVYQESLYIGADNYINDLGFYPHLLGNQSISERTHVGYLRARPYGPFNLISNDWSYGATWDPNAGGDFGGTSFPLVESQFIWDGMLRLRSGWEIGWNARYNGARFDDAETRQNAYVRLYRRPATESLWLRLRSNDSKPFWVQPHYYFDVEGGTLTINPGLDVGLLAGGRLQLGTTLNWRQWFDRQRWIDTGVDGFPLIGALQLQQIEITLRGTVAFTRNLTLQVFTQLLRSMQHYPHVFALRDPWRRQACDPGTMCVDAQPPGTYDEDLTSLILNSVLRWEFHAGSTLFLVYTHNHQISDTSGRFDFGHALSTLSDTPADNVVAFKLSYLWSL